MRRASPAAGSAEPCRPAQAAVDSSRVSRLAGQFARHRRPVLLLALLAVAGLGLLGAGAGGTPAAALGYDDPAAESSRADRLLVQANAGVPNFYLLIDAPEPITEPGIAAAGAALVAELRATPGVVYVRSYWDTSDPDLAAADRRATLVQVLLGGDAETSQRHAAEVSRRFTGARGPFRVAAAGQALLDQYAESRSRAELVRAELLTLPLVLLVVLWFYRSVAAALVLLLVGGVTAVGAFATLSLLARFIDVSVHAVSITTMLGLGLAFDYSLVMVSRFREELANRGSVAGALPQTLRASGRTVAFSALTVALALCPLLIFPQPVLRSLGLAIVTVVLFAGAATLLVVPAALAIAGTRINHELFPARWRRGPAGTRSELWERLPRWVLGRQWRVLVLGTLAAGLLAVPVLGLHSSVPDHRLLATDAPPRAAAERILAEFPDTVGSMPRVVLPATGVGDPAVASYAAELTRLPGVLAAIGPDGVFAGGERDPERGRMGHPLPGGGTWLVVVSEHAPASSQARDLVATLRTLPAPGPSLVGGETAALVDFYRSLRELLPWAVGFLVLATAVLLFALTRSLLLPAKALLANALTVLASYGVLVYVFQEGHLGWVFGHTATGGVHPSVLLVIFALTLGVSMDYEVLLLARIREEYLRRGCNREAVVAGIRRTGRLVTACALVLVIPLVALATSASVALKMFGLVLAFAVALDATLVRCLLVPAFMGIAGRWNWWLPRPLAHLSSPPCATRRR